MTIHPMAAVLFHMDRRTDRRTNMTKVIVAFRYFANMPNEESKTTCG
jgi:hypothetical protein